MKKIAMLMLVCCLAVSANAATYQLADYITDQDFDDTVSWTTTINGYNAAPVSTATSLGWYSEGYSGHNNYVEVGAAADSGTQVVSFLTHSDYGPVALKAFPSEYLNNGDTWEFTFKAKKDDLVHTWVNNACDIEVFIMDGVGGVHGLMTIAGSSLTTDWQEFTYSTVYDGNQMWPAGWNIFIRGKATSTFGAVLVDTVGAVVPEPTVMCLVGLGALGLLRRRK